MKILKKFDLTDVLKLVASLLLTLLAGSLGSLSTSKSISTWYPTLIKPAFNPPNWIFGPVWTVLFIFMGISLFLIIKYGAKEENYYKALYFFGTQLILNVLWSIAFFGFKSPLGGLVIILPLLGFIILTGLNFYKINKIAGYLFIPYALWVSFATILNISILILNL